jgi:hypothetical protein
MKHLILAFLIAVASFTAHADNITGTDPDRTIVALDGTKYEKVVVTGTNADGIRISYSDGTAKIPFENLSPELQKEFGYDPARASQFRAAMNASAQRATANLQKQKQMEARFGTWTQELARKKQLALTSPSDIYQRGGSKKEVDAFEIKSTQIINAFETRLNSLRQLIAALDLSGASYESTKTLIDAVYDEKVFVGMPAPFVRLSWGEPSDINTSLYGNSRSEQWVYRHGIASASYVFLTDGVVKSIQN